MRDDPYTQKLMESARSGATVGEGRFDGLRAEAAAAVGYSANTLRAVRERYREAYGDALVRWQAVHDELEAVDRAVGALGPVASEASAADQAASAAEAGAEDARSRILRSEVDQLTGELGLHQSELGKLELAQHTLERTWLFLERGDATLVTDSDGPPTAGDIAMRLLEAQEAERSRLAQEVHDGPAQALANAIFQVEYIEKVVKTDQRLAQTELRFLRELLRRELGDVRTFISQLRPPMLDERGLGGAIADAVDHTRTLTGLQMELDTSAPEARLSTIEKTVALRITQEALQNVRKHANASHVSIRTMVEDGIWTLEIRDDGRGFDSDAVVARGRQNFGLQFMRERAELIGARFDVRSRTGGGTVVRLSIPGDEATTAKEVI